MPDLTDREKRRNKVLEAMPWYDELHPDFTELDAVLDELAAPALPAGLPDVEERAALLRDLIEEARYIRGRLTKVTLADYGAILAALEGSATLPSDPRDTQEGYVHGRLNGFPDSISHAATLPSDRKPWQHPRLGVAALRESTTEDILAEAKTQEYCGDCDGTGWVEGGETIKTTCERCKGSGWEPSADT